MEFPHKKINHLLKWHLLILLHLKTLNIWKYKYFKFQHHWRVHPRCVTVKLKHPTEDLKWKEVILFHSQCVRCRTACPFWSGPSVSLNAPWTSPSSRAGHLGWLPAPSAPRGAAHIFSVENNRKIEKLRLSFILFFSSFYYLPLLLVYKKWYKMMYIWCLFFILVFKFS